MAENLKDNTAELRRFKRAERGRTGAKSIKRGTAPGESLVCRVLKTKCPVRAARTIS